MYFVGLAVPIIKVRKGKLKGDKKRWKNVERKGRKWVRNMKKKRRETRKGKSQFIQKISEQVERINISKHDDDDGKWQY